MKWQLFILFLILLPEVCHSEPEFRRIDDVFESSDLIADVQVISAEEIKQGKGISLLVYKLSPSAYYKGPSDKKLITVHQRVNRLVSTVCGGPIEYSKGQIFCAYLRKKSDHFRFLTYPEYIIYKDKAPPSFKGSSLGTKKIKISIQQLSSP